MRWCGARIRSLVNVDADADISDNIGVPTYTVCPSASNVSFHDSMR